ncbi:methyltransferase domain-containing protein [Kutzneria viridogrisea]|uniref:Protein-L-isoaspartate O-methyltransferase n=1 Tax=Kutzneria viridogrisea TaxID=47990 RepID=A0ABR6BZP5_9PSEU|nr:protein-L-isoaspartate O-methyltransferase [Kutzneria viridogrisea]
MTTTEHLATALRAAGHLPDAWRDPVLAVPRHAFLPDRVWIDDNRGRPHPLSRTTDPDQWLAAAYSDIPVLTQFDDGHTAWPSAAGLVCTSSASKPTHVLAMLTALDARPGHRVLEIGTGTGYNAALLAARLGAANVTTVEIDPALAERARAALVAAGQPVTVITGDGTRGHPAGVLFDRVLSTAAVRVGALPSAWVAQTRPGGVIVTPTRTDFGGAVALVAFTVTGDGTAVGHPVGRLGFMAVRGHRTPAWSTDHLDPEDPAAEISTTTLRPWRIAETHDARWAIGTRVPDCVWEHQPPVPGRPQHQLWLLDPVGGSWALARYDSTTGPRQIRQCGPRRLWDETEAAFRQWAALGKPPLERSRLIVTRTTQTVQVEQAEATAAAS